MCCEYITPVAMSWNSIIIQVMSSWNDFLKKASEHTTMKNNAKAQTCISFINLVKRIKSG